MPPHHPALYAHRHGGEGYPRRQPHCFDGVGQEHPGDPSDDLPLRLKGQPWQQGDTAAIIGYDWTDVA
jgi:hypothetical protein